MVCCHAIKLHACSLLNEIISLWFRPGVVLSGVRSARAFNHNGIICIWNFQPVRFFLFKCSAGSAKGPPLHASVQRRVKSIERDVRSPALIHAWQSHCRWLKSGTGCCCRWYAKRDILKSNSSYHSKTSGCRAAPHRSRPLKTLKQSSLIQR